MDISITAVGAGDVESIKSFLVANDLPTAGVDDHWKTFVVARSAGVMVGCGGAETYPAAALIRSIAVAPEHRSSGVGGMIVRQLLDHLNARGIRDFYLLTTTAEAFFHKRGFNKIVRDEVNPQLLASREFQDACPTSATCMRLVMLL